MCRTLGWCGHSSTEQQREGRCPCILFVKILTMDWSRQTPSMVLLASSAGFALRTKTKFSDASTYDLSCQSYFHHAQNFARFTRTGSGYCISWQHRCFRGIRIQSLTRGRMTSNQIEAARVAINRHLKRKGKVWIRVFPHKPVTKKPAETRQGKGKGPVDHWVAVIKPGHVLFEIAGCSLTLAREALGLADAKLPFVAVRRADSILLIK